MRKAYRLLQLGLFAGALLITQAYVAGASDWQKIGYGTLEGQKFDVYVDPGTVLRVGDKVRFWQGHVFYSGQSLPSGVSYKRVSIEREGDCAENTSRNLQAIFYGTDGSMVFNYTVDDTLDASPPDTINMKAVQFACSYSNPNPEGISR